MRVLPVASALVVLASSVTPATFEPAVIVGTQAAQRPLRLPAQPSDLLTSSPLGVCSRSGAPAAVPPNRLHIATWNIHASLSAPLEEIAAELKTMQADVIALQEVDVRVHRTDFVDEPAVLAAALGYHYVFAASIKWDEGDYGLAVLSRWPLTEFHRYRLDARSASEPRIVLEATVCAAGQPLRIYNHHADGRAISRDAGFVALRDIVKDDVGRGVLVLGDFNEHADGTGVRGLIDAGLVDLGAAGNIDTANEGRIDYLLADGPLARRASAVRVWRTDKSDHNAVLVDLQW